MAKKTTSDQVLEQLHLWGLRCAFGYDGGTGTTCESVLLSDSELHLLPASARGIRTETVQVIRQIVTCEKSVRCIWPGLSMYLGAEDMLAAIKVRFASDLPAETTVGAIHRIEVKAAPALHTQRS